MMKFNIVVGNPPYQDSISVNNKLRAIYPYFYDIAENLSEKYTLISPARFLFNTGLTSKVWNKKMLTNKNFKVVHFEEDATCIFPNISIKGGVMISYYDVNTDFGEIKEFIPNKKLRKIAKKLERYSKDFTTVVYSGRSDLKFTEEFLKHYPQSRADRLNDIKKRYSKVSSLSKGEEFELKSSSFNVLFYVFKKFEPIKKEDYYKILGLERGKRVYRWIHKKYMKPRRSQNHNINFYKVFLPESNGTGRLGEVLSTPIIGYPNESTTPTFISIGKLETKEEAENLLKYIKTKFTRALLGICKKTQHNPASSWHYVPLQDFTEYSDINWKVSISEIDKQLYKKYNFDEEDINFVESNIKTMEGM